MSPMKMLGVILFGLMGAGGLTWLLVTLLVPPIPTATVPTPTPPTNKVEPSAVIEVEAKPPPAPPPARSSKNPPLQRWVALPVKDEVEVYPGVAIVGYGNDLSVDRGSLILKIGVWVRNSNADGKYVRLRMVTTSDLGELIWQTSIVARWVPKGDTLIEHSEAMVKEAVGKKDAEGVVIRLEILSADPDA